ncbi:uncharacterized protein AMSG_12402 [Thecamonas trahens ATCC 50062]|uniref:RRM domain-containing protein n=1 Tax=Thecamonas trahens ATCC 50062 TaxID=461836 RepID=A0A0L0DUY2_THETB|nr:hypothetical protein AMSG_12402 [Thecamonas trahens ATCC 50062]KNC55328.1 hypothetical protein AMSG_12402 [Thecamonas trahens ATCC 50062]|eukprot:XP_013753077.1 hypothetical protein AMSG_12402 [Thecamonas trahens ATCC 50062]
MRRTRGVAAVVVTVAFAAWWTLLVDHEPATFVNNLDELSNAWGVQRSLDDGYAPSLLPERRRTLGFVVEANRKALAKVDQWMDSEVLAQSLTGYGLDADAVLLLDRDLGREPVLTDVLSYLTLYLYEPLSVLVIGDEVGKSVFQLLNLHSQAALTALCIEDINPTLERFLTRSTVAQELGPPALPFGYKSPRSHGAPATVTRYVYKPKDNTLAYYAGDVQDDAVWTALEGAKFNVIVSLVDLSPQLLRYMYSKLTRHDLIVRSEFVLLFDGLADDALVPIFRDMVKDLGSHPTAAASDGTPHVSSCVARMRGALLGKNAPYRDVGLITTLDLSEFRRRHVVDPVEATYSYAGMFVDHTFRPVGVMAAAAMTASGTFGTESELDTLGTEPLSGEPQTGSRASIGFVTRPAVGAGFASFRRVMMAMTRRRAGLCGSMWDLLPHQASDVGVLVHPGGAAVATAGGHAPRPGAMVAAGTAMYVPRALKRVFVGNLPPETTADTLGGLLSEAMRRHGLVAPDAADPINVVILKMERRFAFVELRSPEVTTRALALDGIPFLGVPLRISRPKDYIQPPGAPPPPPPIYFSQDGGNDPLFVADIVRESPHKIYLGGLDKAMTRDQVMALVAEHAPLAALNLVPDAEKPGHSRGFAFFQLRDVSQNAAVIAALDGKTVSGSQLICRFSKPPGGGTRPGPGPSAFATGANMAPLSAPTPAPVIQPTAVLMLLNMVVRGDLLDPDEYEDIVLDVKEEAANYGTVASVVIPRPGTGPNGGDPPGIGKVFVAFASADEAARASAELAGRTFGDRTVLAAFYDEAKFAAGDYS